MAFAEFRLALGRLRGDQPEDERLFSARFIELFGRGSTPQADRSRYPEPNEILDTLDRVHQQALGTIATFTDVELDEPQIGPPHRIFSTKLDALFWCARHEMLHAGQIGLLKRLQGNAPRW